MEDSTKLQVEVRPRDIFKHYVHIHRPGDILQWSFCTKKKNIAFGLYYLYLSSSSTLAEPPAQPTHSTTENNSEEEMRHEMTVSCEFVHELFNKSISLVKIEPGPSTFTAAQSGKRSGRRESHESLPDTGSEPMQNVRVPSPLGELVEILAVEKYPSFETVIHGSIDAPISGTYVLVFDNSFSINTSKQLIFSVDVIAARGLGAEGGLLAAQSKVSTPIGATSKEEVAAASVAASLSTNVLQGWLLKKKKRRLQGWNRRWFTLDPRGTLAYHGERGGPIRGAMSIADCTITKVPNRWLITLDSGQDTFHLKALSTSDYSMWAEKISEVRNGALARIPKASGTVANYLRDCSAKLEILKDLASQLDGQVVGRFIGPLENSLTSFSTAFEELKLLAKSITGEEGTPELMTPSAVYKRSFHSDDELNEDVFYDVLDEVVISDVSESEFKTAEMGAVSEGILEDQLMVTDLLPPSGAPTPAPLILPLLRQRTSLPVPSGPCTVSIASILRKSIGKDSSGFSMPVGLNEPLSALQRLCEELEYVDLLDRANESGGDPVLQIALVAAFAVSAYSSMAFRADRKPFNPMLGETYEWIEGDLRFVAEKVAHRPVTVLACHAQRLGKWTWAQDQAVKSKNWGKSIEYIPMGQLQFTIHNSGSGFELTFTWKKVISCLRNIWSSTKTVENYGDMIIECSNGFQALVNFKSSGFFGSSGENQVSGYIVDSSGDQLGVLRGRWDDHLILERPQHDLKMLWKANPMPASYQDFYGFSFFALRLNAELDPEEEKLVPPTDSRRRPDQRLLEYGRMDEAEREKARIEDIQRKRRAQMEANGQFHRPLWFMGTPHSPRSSPSVSPIEGGESESLNIEGELRFLFTDRYWEEKLSVSYPPIW